jgi:hypothetical protein
MLIISAMQVSAQPETHMRVTGTGGDGLILRAEARGGAPQLAVEPEGAVVTVIGPEQSTAGRVWMPVRDVQGRVGWLAAEYLAPEQVAVATPTSLPQPLVAIEMPAPAEPEPTATSVSKPLAKRAQETEEAEPEPGPPVTLEVRFKLPEIDRRDRQTIYVDVTRNSRPVQDVIVRFTVEDENPEVEREARVTNAAGRSTHEWSMRKYRGTTTVRVVAIAPDGGTGKAARSFFVK